MMLRNIAKTSNVFAKPKFPEKFKGTILEKWADYWKNLFIDYRQMFQDLRSDVQEQPRKAFIWATGLTTIYALVRNNPKEIDFQDYLKQMSNEVILVSEECLNRKSIEHIRYLNRCSNEGVIHYKNFGIASVIYVTDINDSCDLYKSQCSYLKPTLLSFPSRVIDIGMFGKWWNIYIKTTNYDVNL
ncbi:mitochondrial import inner membrane translocase subunit Tim29 [Battus philenor]|uniref:mitochondrial import inner membrane translocase subunit Tim29 n=1 Tax=Battus philenor TaxID=42288 RepID=UPI0035CFCCC7